MSFLCGCLILIAMWSAFALIAGYESHENGRRDFLRGMLFATLLFLAGCAGIGYQIMEALK